MKATLVLGASDKTDRFSNRAIRKLLAHGHQVVPVAPREMTIEGIESLTNIEQVKSPVDTVTLYINPLLVEKELDKIIQVKPRRVIFNPGTESASASKRLSELGIQVVEDCTLIMLDSGSY